jgi:hypothetical protein
MKFKMALVILCLVTGGWISGCGGSQESAPPANTKPAAPDAGAGGDEAAGGSAPAEESGGAG